MATKSVVSGFIAEGWKKLTNKIGKSSSKFQKQWINALNDHENVLEEHLNQTCNELKAYILAKQNYQDITKHNLLIAITSSIENIFSTQDM
eukprot:469382_1